jgi:hypothetical protein
MADDSASDSEPVGRVPGRPDPDRPVQRTPARPAPAGRSRPISIDVTPRNLHVSPGQAETAAVNIRYHGAVVDELTLTVTGEASSWARVVPDSLNVYPDTEGQAAIRFTPPKASRPLAGLLELGLEVASASQPEASTSWTGSIEIEPYDELSATAEGSTSLSGAREAVLPIKLRNLGNRPADVTLRPAPSPGATVSLSANSLTLEPGGEATVWLTIQPLAGSSPHAARLIPFTVSVSSQYSAPITIDGRMEQPAVAGRRPLALVALAGLALLAVAAGVVYAIVSGAGPSPTHGPNVTATVSPSGPTTTAPSTQPTQSQSTATATPTPLSLGARAAGMWELELIESRLLSAADAAGVTSALTLNDPLAAVVDVSWAYPSRDESKVLECWGKFDLVEQTVVATTPFADLDYFSQSTTTELNGEVWPKIIDALCGVHAIITNGAFGLEFQYGPTGTFDVTLSGGEPWELATGLELSLPRLGDQTIKTTLTWVRVEP